MARVDVIVPCYNYGRYLGGCVRSALDQGGVDVRVLVLDDASADDTEAVGRRLAERDRRVGYRRHPANRGHIATYHEGLDWAAELLPGEPAEVSKSKSSSMEAIP